MSITYILEGFFVCFFFWLPFLFLESHCKLAHLSGVFSILRFLSTFPVRSSFPVLETAKTVNLAVCLETRRGIGVTGLADVGFGGSHRETCGSGVLTVSGRLPSWLAASGTTNVWFLYPDCITLLAASLTFPAQQGILSWSMFTSITPQTHDLLFLPRTPEIPGVPLPTALGIPHMSLSPPSRTVVEHGALRAQWRMFEGGMALGHIQLDAVKDGFRLFFLCERFRFHTLSLNAKRVTLSPLKR